MGDDRPRQRELTGVSVTSIYDLCPTAPRPPARAANRGPPRLGDCLARPAPAADRVWADRLARRCRGGGPARRAVACGILHSVVLAPAHVAAFVAGRSTPGPTPLRCSLMAVSRSFSIGVTSPSRRLPEPIPPVALLAKPDYFLGTITRSARGLIEGVIGVLPSAFPSASTTRLGCVSIRTSRTCARKTWPPELSPRSGCDIASQVARSPGSGPEARTMMPSRRLPFTSSRPPLALIARRGCWSWLRTSLTTWPMWRLFLRRSMTNADVTASRLREERWPNSRGGRRS